MVDTKAFRNLSYGLYIISSKKDGKSVGCVVNTFSQVTSTPAQVTVAVNKENYTSQGIQETGAYEVAVMNYATTAIVWISIPTDCLNLNSASQNRFRSVSYTHLLKP